MCALLAHTNQYVGIGVHEKNLPQTTVNYTTRNRNYIGTRTEPHMVCGNHSVNRIPDVQLTT